MCSFLLGKYFGVNGWSCKVSVGFNILGGLTMKGEAFTFNHEGQSRKGNKHPLAPTEAVGGEEKQRGG